MGDRGVLHEPSEEGREYVRRAVAAGLTQEIIAEVMDLSPTTLKRHYRRELDVGGAEMVERVASRLYAQALSDSDGMPATVARIFVLKARGAWRDQVIAHTDADGGPLNGDKRPIVVLLPPNGREVLPPAKPRVIDVGSGRSPSRGVLHPRGAAGCGRARDRVR